MITAALRDLQHRRRRFVIVVLGTALVLALSLVMSGISASFGKEADRTLDLSGARSWIVREDVPGPFTAYAPFPASSVAAVDSAAQRKGGRAAGMLIGRQTVPPRRGGVPLDVIVVGVQPGRVGLDPLAIRKGRAIRRAGEAVISTTLGRKIGERLQIGAVVVTVVGTIPDATLFAGTPNVYVSLADAQTLFTQAQPLVSAVVANVAMDDDDLRLRALPTPLRALATADAKEDVMRPLKKPQQTIVMVQALLWLVAALIVGSAVYLNALERSRDFAVFKATGISARAISGGLVFQALVLTLAAAILGVIVAILLAPVFPMNVSIPSTAYAVLLVVAIGVAALSSLGGVRRTARIDPALAFGGQ